jgi:hypothetical protein
MALSSRKEVNVLHNARRLSGSTPEVHSSTSTTVKPQLERNNTSRSEPLTLRATQQPDRKLQLPLLPSRQSIGIGIDLLGQIAVPKQLFQIFLRIRVLRPLHSFPHSECLQTRKLREQDIFLRNNANRPARWASLTTFKDDLASSRSIKAANDTQRCRLSSAESIE